MRATAALTVSLVLLLSACASDDSGAAKGPGGAEGSGTSSAEATPEPEPLVLGDQRYRMPCRLLGPADVRKVYGDLGPYATFGEEGREVGQTSEEMTQVGRTVAGAVKDRCSYSFSDERRSTLTVEVAQYASASLARKAWKRTRRLGTGKESEELSRRSAAQWLVDLTRENERDLGGVPVPGLDSSVLYVENYGHFVGVHDNLVLTVARKTYAGGNPFTPKSVRGDLRRMRQVFDTLYERADDPDLDQAPAPAGWDQPTGWPAFVRPCAVFDDEVMEAATGRRSSRGEFTSDSTFLSPETRQRRNRLPAFQAVDNSCERTARRETKRVGLPRTWQLKGEVWYAAPGTTGEDLLRGLPIRKLYKPDDQDRYDVDDLVKATALRVVDVPGADAAYLFDYRVPEFGRIGWIMASRGDRVVFLDPEQPARNKRKNAFLDSDPVPPQRMVAAAAKALENLDGLAD